MKTGKPVETGADRSPVNRSYWYGIIINARIYSGLIDGRATKWNGLFKISFRSLLNFDFVCLRLFFLRNKSF